MNRFFRLPGGLPPGDDEPTDANLADKNKTTMQTFLMMPMLRNYLIAVFSLGVALGAGVNHGMNRTAIYYESTLEETMLTRAEYERVALQMSITQVEAILGRGTEISQTEDFLVFEWKNQDGSSITVFFENGYLVQKSQEDL